ncbi:MAG: hypothetical protein LBR12_06885, partial [Opitutaceae bacterium]|nr:hypothetical protein [Opitutaceae bacterium]
PTRRSSDLAGLDAKSGLKPSGEIAPDEWRADAPGLAETDIVDLTDALAPDGSLSWEAPPGRWVVLRFGFTTTGRVNHPAPEEGTGLEVDKLDGAAVARHFEGSLGRILREWEARPATENKNVVGGGLSGVLCDSWEAGAQNWTDKLPAVFRERRGYDLTRWLPVLAGRVIGSRAESEAFLADFRRTLGELYASEYYGTLRRLANARGLALFAESYGGVFDDLSATANVDVPMVEFWNHNLYKNVGEAVSVARFFGRRLVLAEAWTGRPPRARWTETPASLRALGDKAFAAGVNGMVLHSYVHQPGGPAPGFTHGRYGTHFGRLNAWWPLADGWIDYLRRCQLMLRAGRAVTDVLELREERLKSETRELPAPPAEGFAADLVAPAHLKFLSVDGGLSRPPGGGAYRLLSLPENWVADSETLAEIVRLREAGATIRGALPAAPSSLRDARALEKWQSLCGRLGDGDLSLEEGSAAAVLARIGAAPDFVFTEDTNASGGRADLRFTHRKVGGDDVYFVSNQSGRDAEGAAVFRDAGGRAPELWFAENGLVARAPSWRLRADGAVSLPLALGADRSVFVVFRGTPAPAGGAGGAAAVRWPFADAGGGLLRETGAADVKGPWRVAFAPASGRKIGDVGMTALRLLSESPEEPVRHFAGVARHETEFDLDAARLADGTRVFLDLGDVADLARVTLNGRDLGTLWQAPFAVDVTAACRAGKNALSVAVANRWVNRLIGDEKLPPDAVYSARGNTRDALAAFPPWWGDAAAEARRARRSFATWRHYTAESPLVKSGLGGPVRLRFFRKENQPLPE